MASLAFSVLSACLLAATADPTHERFAYRQPHMGVAVDIVLYAPDEPAANAAAHAAYDRFAALNKALSDYDPGSELSRLSDTAGSGVAVPVSDDLWLVLAEAQALSARSEGAFDVTVGPLVKLWRRARRTRQMPAADRLAAARQAVGYRHLSLVEDGHRVELAQPGMRLDLGGIAMGYAVDEALEILRARGVTRALVDASGDIGAGDPPPGESGWRIGIAPLESPDGPPSRFLSLANAAVTTSGDAFQHVQIDGRRYSHIVDPKTGLGLSDLSSVTVVAGNCITADSLATAVSVLGPEAGLRLVADTPGAAVLFVRNISGKVETHESEGMKELLVEPPAGAD